MKKFLIFLSSFLIFPFWLSANTNREGTITKIKTQISKATTPKDSLKLLLDLWDISLRNDRMAIGHQIYNLAGRNNNPDLQLDIVRQMTTMSSNDSVLNLLKQMATRVPESQNQKETILFINIRRIASQARHMDEDSRQAKIVELASKNDYQDLDKYEKVELLFSICEYLSNFIEGNLLEKYLKDLNRIMDEQGIESYPIRNMFYTESANIFTATGSHRQAIETDRKLLSIIKELENEYKRKGRKYRNYDVPKFISYRRMLCNYEALSLDSVNQIYDNILQLAAKNEDVKKELERDKRPAAYHAMKNGNYVEVIALLRNRVESVTSLPIRRQLYKMLIEAATQTGDKYTLEEAKVGYNKIKATLDDKQAVNNYNDLRVRYMVNILIADNTRLELEQKNEQIKSARTTMIFILIGWIVLALALVFVLMFWARHRRALSHLSNFITVLSDERTRLKKRRYGADLGRKKSTYRPALIDKDDKSVKSMINYILNDILYISSIGLDESENFTEKVDVASFMQNSQDTLKANLKKNVKVNFKYPESNFDIEVDKYCLQKLTDHIMNVAVRLAPNGGEVGMECCKDDNFAKIIYTHSGESLPDGKEELIFKNFVEYEDLSKNEDAALHYCRMIHFLLDTELRSDRSVDYGRLILYIPLHPGC